MVKSNSLIVLFTSLAFTMTDREMAYICIAYADACHRQIIDKPWKTNQVIAVTGFYRVLPGYRVFAEQAPHVFCYSKAA